MNISYDCATDSLYVHLTNEVGCVVDEVESGVVVDVDANGATGNRGQIPINPRFEAFTP